MLVTQIAETVGVSRRFVYKWAQRFLQYGLEGRADKPGRGRRRCRASRTGHEQSTAPRDFGWCWTGVTGWGRVAPQGVPWGEGLGKGRCGRRPLIALIV